MFLLDPINATQTAVNVPSSQVPPLYVPDFNATTGDNPNVDFPKVGEIFSDSDGNSYVWTLPVSELIITSIGFNDITKIIDFLDTLIPRISIVDVSRRGVFNWLSANTDLKFYNKPIVQTELRDGYTKERYPFTAGSNALSINNRAADDIARVGRQMGNQAWQPISANSLVDKIPSAIVSVANTLTASFSVDSLFNTITLINTKATAVKIETLRGTSVQATHNLTLPSGGANGDLILREIVPFSSTSGKYNVRVTITNSNGDRLASCGQVVFGNELAIGESVPDTFNLNGVDPSEVGQDFLGNLETRTQQARYAASVQVKIPRDQTSQTRGLLTGFRGGRNGMFYMSDDFAYGTSIYGFVSDFNIRYDSTNQEQSLLDLSLAGLY